VSATAPPAPSRLAPSDDGLGIADLLDLLGLEYPADLTADDAADDADDAADDAAEDATADGPAAVAGPRRPADAVAVVRGWVRRAADWGSGPERSWCAW
jgi:hypothetical protein